MCLLSSKIVLQESFRSLYKGLFGENICKEVEEKLSENCKFHKRLNKFIIVSIAPSLKFIFFCYSRKYMLHHPSLTKAMGILR